MKLKPLTALVLAASLALTPGCMVLGGAKDPSSAQQAAHVAFGFAKAGLEYLEEETATWIGAMPDPTPEDLEKAAEQVQRLRRAKTALELAEPYVTGEKEGEATLKTYIADAADALILVANELKSHGLKIPTAILTGLKLAKAYASEA